MFILSIASILLEYGYFQHLPIIRRTDCAIAVLSLALVYLEFHVKL